MSRGLQGGVRLGGPARLAVPPGSHSYVVPIILLLLLPLGWWLWDSADDPPGPASLEELVLVDPRGPGCLRLIIAVDDSGSMRDFAAARDAALAQFLRWVGLPDNLRDDDELAVVDFAAESAVRLQPSSPDSGTGALRAPAVQDGVDTLLAPVLETVSGFPTTDCATALAFLSDAQLSDLPASEEGRRSMMAAGVDTVLLLVPGQEIDVPPQWRHAFPAAAPMRFDGHDAEDTARTFGETVAGLVDQTLERRTVRP
jgi:hypothetical protein